MSKLKRYLVFAYEHCYPKGGMDDFRYSADNLPSKESLKDFINSQKYLIDGAITVYDIELSKQVICLTFDNGDFKELDEYDNEINIGCTKNMCNDG